MNIYLFQRIMGIGILALHIIIAFLIIYLTYKKVTKKSIKCVENIFGREGLFISAGLSLLAIVGSLVFSDIYHIEPCKLCWVQRIFIYPQLLIAGIAVWKCDASAWTYLLWLSILGFIVAAYQTLEQFRIKALPEIDCVIGPDAACSQINMLEFGYITFPLASATLFVFVIILYIMRKK